MGIQFSITKCAIEFRVKKEEFEDAVKYYEDLFGVKRQETSYPDLVLLELDNKPSEWFFVGIRVMAKGSRTTGPVVYWLTSENTADVFKELLNGRAPSDEDELPTGDLENSSRGSVIDTYDNRFGFTNPNYPPFV